MTVLKIKIGERVLCNGVVYMVRRIISTDVVIGWNEERKSYCELLVKDLTPPQEVPVKPRPVVINVSNKDEQTVNAMFDVIEPLIYGQNNRAKVERQAKVAMSFGLLRCGSPSTIYRWLNKYKIRRNKMDLMKTKPLGGYGKSRLPYFVEELLQQVIESKYLTSQKLSKVAMCEEVEKAFFRENEGRLEGHKLKCPCEKTIRKRLNQMNMEEVVMAREGEKVADEKFGLNSGKLICGRWPWDIIQMDHTELNIFFIDQETGEALWRPWMTAAIDTFSRVIVAFVVSACKPSASTLALCYAMAMLPKESWLERWYSKEEASELYPVWGRPQLSQFDNAWEHEANALKAGCELNGLSYEFRFLKNPKQGAFIESFFRTLKNEVAKWPGTTFHGPKDRENYDSQKKATMTLSRLEQALTNYIVEIYHHKKHKGLNNSPLEVYKNGLIESGVGIPDKIFGREAVELALDFMPYEMRTIQDYGISLNGIQYSDHILKAYMARTTRLSPNGKPIKAKFAIKTLPWDVSSAYMFDEDRKSYVKIPCKDSSFPSISLDEYRYIKDMLKKQRVNPSIENILRARTHLDTIVTGSAKEKKQIVKKYKKTRARADDSTKMPSSKSTTKKSAIKEVVEDLEVSPFSTFRIPDEN